MSSYDPPTDTTGIITQEEMQRSMKLVRLQIATPLSLLMTIGANLVCALAVKPGLADINKMYPTLLTPNAILLGIYWVVVYALQIGFCLILVTARKEETKSTLVHGVGLRFAIANWLQAAWAVAWTLRFFVVSEIIVILNVINLYAWTLLSCRPSILADASLFYSISIQLTLLAHPPSPRHRPLDSLFIHAPMTLFFVILFTQDWVHNGFIALNWLSLPDQPNPYSKTWQASLTLLLVHAFLAVWVAMRLDVWATLGGMGTLLMVLLGNQRKPTIEVVTIVILLVLHPIALVGGLAWKKTKEREGRIRLEEDARGEAEFFDEDV